MDEATRTRQADGSKARRLSAGSAVEQAKAHLMELTGRPCESASSISRGEAGWNVVPAVVERDRIPHSTDMLASYHVALDDEGELLRYERIQRYYRNQSSEE